MRFIKPVKKQKPRKVYLVLEFLSEKVCKVRDVYKVHTNAVFAATRLEKQTDNYTAVIKKTIKDDLLKR